MAVSIKNLLRSSGGLAAATMCSRILGFARELITAYTIGAGSVMSGWLLAFLLPNLFRRILGEGALGTALVPIITHTLALESKENARRKFSTILFWLTLLLCVITLVVSIPAMIIAPFVETEYIRLALRLTPVIMPYCVFICIIGIMMSLLNSLRVFFLPAAAALLLNVMMILCLLYVCPGLQSDPEKMLNALGISVILSGVIEIIIMLILLKKHGFLPKFSKAIIFNMRSIVEIWRLALPGIIGASAYQLGMVFDKGIACWISAYAVPALNYSDRLIYLPIGVFAVSFGTVSLTEMSRSAAVKDYVSMISTMFTSMRYLLFLTVPMAAFMCVFSIPIIRVFYFGGKFGDFEVEQTALAFFYYSFGIPAFAAMKITLSSFYSRKDMKTPLKIAIICIVINMVLNLILMWPLKQGGIALSTVIASYLNNTILLCILHRTVGIFPFARFFRFSFILITASVMPLFPAWWIYNKFFELGWLFSFRKDLLPLTAAAIVFGVLFLLLGYLFRLDEVKWFAGRFIKHRKKEI